MRHNSGCMYPDALPDVTLPGTVTSVAPVATVAQNVVTYAVQVEFDPGAAVKVGMSATADIQIEQADGALLVPSRAIQTSGETSTVTVQQGEATVKVPVTTGLLSDGKTEIVSSGGNGVAALAAGDVVVIASTSSSATSAQSTNPSGGLGNLAGSAGGPTGP